MMEMLEWVTRQYPSRILAEHHVPRAPKLTIVVQIPGVNNQCDRSKAYGVRRFEGLSTAQS